MKIKTGTIKISHRAIYLDSLSNLFKTGTKKSIITENPVWEGAYIIYSYIDRKKRILHLFFHDPINGISIPEGQDITQTKLIDTIFSTEIKEE